MKDGGGLTIADGAAATKETNRTGLLRRLDEHANEERERGGNGHGCGDATQRTEDDDGYLLFRKACSDGNGTEHGDTACEGYLGVVHIRDATTLQTVTRQ